MLYEESRFDDVFTVINDLMDHNEKEKAQQKDAVAVALNLLEQLKDLVSFENEKEIASWEASVDGSNSTNYRRLIESLNENKQSYINKLNDYLESEISEIRKDSKRELDDGLIEIEDCVKSIFADIIVIDEFENYVKQDIRSTQSLLETKIVYLNNQREKVKQEYLREAKKSILEIIHVYLDETIYEILYDNNQSVLEENSKRANQVVISLFEVSFETRIKLLNQMLEQINGTKSYENTADLLSLITKCNQKLEEFLCL